MYAFLMSLNASEVHCNVWKLQSAISMEYLWMIISIQDWTENAQIFQFQTSNQAQIFHTNVQVT